MSNLFPDSRETPRPDAPDIGPRSIQQDPTDKSGATADEFAQWQARNRQDRKRAR